MKQDYFDLDALAAERREYAVTDFPFPLALTYSRLLHEMARQEPVAAVHDLRRLNVGRPLDFTLVWGIESVPTDGDEYAGARKTIELIHRTVS